MATKKKETPAKKPVETPAKKPVETPAAKPHVKPADQPEDQPEGPKPFIAAPAVVVERALGVEITEAPRPNCHYCVYPRVAGTVDVDEVMEALRAAFPQAKFTYFATR